MLVKSRDRETSSVYAVAPGTGSQEKSTRDSLLIGYAWLSGGAMRAGGIRRFLTGDREPCAVAFTFCPLVSFTAGPPVDDATEALPFVAMTAVDFCLSTPT